MRTQRRGESRGRTPPLLRGLLCEGRSDWSACRAGESRTKGTRKKGQELCNVNGRVAMIYSGEVPWHILDTGMAAPTTGLESIAAAVLDYEVVRSDLVTATGIPVRGREAVVRTYADVVFGFVDCTPGVPWPIRIRRPHPGQCGSRGSLVDTHRGCRPPGSRRVGSSMPHLGLLPIRTSELSPRTWATSRDRTHASLPVCRRSSVPIREP